MGRSIDVSLMCRLREWALRLLLLVVATTSSSSAVRSQATETREYEVKAAFLYNFARYIKWPEKRSSSSGNAFVIGVIGVDPFGSALDQMVQGKAIQGKPVVVRRFAKPEDATSSDILFIGASERDNLPGILALVSNAPILTVGDMPEFAQRGGIINLVVSDNRVQFEVNLEAAERARLTPSSQLLRLARIVPQASMDR